MNLSSHKIGSAISALVIGSVFFLAALQLKIDQGYNDFVVGGVAGVHNFFLLGVFGFLENFFAFPRKLWRRNLGQL
ncbi:hypothetical protein BA171_00025 [Candidatus Hamiltonella defensa (Bemisia tabaci)]|uniref:Uncharacterized protein n=1 Tax=Candidatus Hamiltonella defensa (Bemisia tabaci) TaxID=672795 RepID=A0A249DX06_9ENTR|nr:hypothetical protein BA171_00025 [Candidatus Hamiltonella defensa (Bemisia tabaci)]